MAEEKELRLKKEDINFDEGIECDDYRLWTYLEETDALDKIAGIYDQALFEANDKDVICLYDIYGVNYYLNYDVETEDVYVDVYVTVYEKDDLDKLRDEYPEFVKRVYELYTRDNDDEHKLPLCKEETDVIVGKFRDYAYEDLKGEFPGSNFDEVIDTYVYDALGLDRD